MAWVVSSGLYVAVGKVPIVDQTWDKKLGHFSVGGGRRFQASIKQAYKKQAMKLGSLELGHWILLITAVKCAPEDFENTSTMFRASISFHHVSVSVWEA